MLKRIALAVTTAAMTIAALGGVANAGTATGHANRVVKLHQDGTATIKANVAHTYTTTTTGGTGQVIYTIPSLPTGTYLVSFTASFFPVAGENFSCAVYPTRFSSMYAQDTTYSPVASGFYEGVNGVAAVKNPTSNGMEVLCGTADGSSWSWGTRSLRITLTSLDGLTSGSLSPAAKPKQGANPAMAR